MPLLNFQKQFAPKVESGEKNHTIRARRKDGRDPRKGQTLFHYTGLRTKASRKLGESICTRSVPIHIDPDYVVVAGIVLSDYQEETLATSDGFDTVSDFREFFLKNHPKKGTGEEQFDGYLIQWESLKQNTENKNGQ